MQIERADKEIIIRLKVSISDKELLELLDYVSYLELASKSKTTQEEVDKLADEVNASWWKENGKNFTEKTKLSLSDFSFAKSRKVLENYKGSLSDAVTEERRTEL